MSKIALKNWASYEDRIPGRWSVGERIRDRWEVCRILRGQASLVYVTYDHELKEPLAAKTPAPEVLARRPELAQELLRQVRPWAELEPHPSVVALRAVEEIDGAPFLFLEYVVGSSLRRCIGGGGVPGGLAQVLRFAIQCCDGMTHALSQGIPAHGDLRPRNCLIAADGSLKVTDFGLDCMLDREDLADRVSQGDDEEGEDEADSRAAETCAYRAPERFAEAAGADVRADVYSFGVMLFHMLTGRLPFEGHTWSTFERLHGTAPPPSVTAGQPDDARFLYETLDEIVQRCLSKLPDDRFKEFDTLRDRLAETYWHLTGTRIAPPLIGPELDAAIWNLRGVGLEDLGRADEAGAAYDKALDLSPRCTEAWINSANLLLRLGRRHAAVNYYERALKLDDTLQDAWARKGAALRELDRRDEALACFDRALELDPALSDVWYTKGNTLREVGKNEDAVACYDRVLEVSPRDQKVWFNKGVALGAVGKYKEALACFDRALGLDPRDEKAWFNKGVALSAMGQAEEALACYDRALARNYRDEKAWSNKGNILAKLGRHEEALVHYDRALELNPADETAWFNKGVTLGKLSRHEESIDCYDRTVAINPRNGKAWLNRGAALANTEKYQEALGSFERAQELGQAQAAQAMVLCRRRLAQQ